MSKKRTLDAFFSPTVKKPKTELGTITPSELIAEEVRNRLIFTIPLFDKDYSLRIQRISSIPIPSRTYQPLSAKSWPLYQINLVGKSMTSLIWIFCTLSLS
jgi:hypothetical protein